MATKVSAQIQPQTKATESEFQYLSNGENVRLSFGLVKRYLVNGGGNVTDQEVMMFMTLCKYQHLNPFLRECYLIKYGNYDASIVTSKDVFIKRAMKNPNFDGMEGGIIVQGNETGELIERPGSFYIKSEETLVGGWAKVYMKNLKYPIQKSVNLEDYEGKTKDGKPNTMWAAKGSTMIAKVAQMQALREAFPEDLGGMYAQEEIVEAQGVTLSETAITPPAPEAQQEEPQIPGQMEFAAEPTTSAAEALFGE